MKRSMPLTIILLVLLAYAIGFYGMVRITGVNHGFPYIAHTFPDGAQVFHCTPYHFGGRYCEVLFFPMEQMDRRMRPGLWEKRPVAVVRRTRKEPDGTFRMTMEPR